ncbi:MAG: PDZ domain-containing protein, partial [Verrucomicrobia bacterium]|nr:PDZ domain-containing protein [Verrucomicrobiota bacterium]
PITGGVPERITHHGAPDRMLNWYPDGKSILFASRMTSEKDRFNKLFKVSDNGGLPDQLPIPYGEFGDISPDGKLLAYTPISRDFRTWKRYRGGMAPDIWLFNLETMSAKNITDNRANDAQPMWHGAVLYFLSDRGKNKRANIWAYDTRTQETRRITNFKDFDVHFPSAGPNDIVFECGGRLYLLDLKTEEYESVSISVVTDQRTLKPRTENVSNLIRSGDISPSGKRAVFGARGELFTVPEEHGIIRSLTLTSGAAERFPAWSPDGEWIAYFSDASGEYELTIIKSDGSGEEKQLTSLGEKFRYHPQWSPDSKKIAFIDNAMRIMVYDFETEETEQIDKGLFKYQGELNDFKVSWSSDSRWMAYSRNLTNHNQAVFLYDFENNERHQVTSGFYTDFNPAIDPDGDFLYFQTSRHFDPSYSDIQNTWIYANTMNLAAVPLRKDVASPLAPRNDEEPGKAEKEDGEKDQKNDNGDPDDAEDNENGDPDNEDAVLASAGSTLSVCDDKKDKKEDKGKKEDKTKDVEKAGKTDTEKAENEKEEEAEPEKKTLQIDLDGFERRIVVLPVSPGHFDDLAAVKGKLIYRRTPRTGESNNQSPIQFYDLKGREEKTILGDADGFALSANHKKMLAVNNGAFSIIDVRPGQSMRKKLRTGELKTNIDPRKEWRQIFMDAWRIERDFFYDPDMHGVDWDAMRERYGRLLEDAVTRWDVNYLIGELIGEMNSSHTYRGGGDTEHPMRRNVGYLGVDFTMENGAYKIKNIVKGASWDSKVRSPLLEPGVDVNEGDYLLAVNGLPIDTNTDPWAAFQGMANETVMLTVNDKPTREGAREVLVKTLNSEYRLRNLAWIEDNRRKVDEATDGKVGYIYVPDTSRNGQNELVRQFRAQFTKQALIIDERFNSGGQIPDRFIELLNRPVYNYWGVRDGMDWQWPPVAHDGPKVMLVNGWSGSGGDAFPYYFRKAKLGPIIGTRTWGGLIGMTGAPRLIDGGSVTVPTFGIYSLKGKWIIEGHGIEPDIKVIDDPSLMAKGRDPQLERAIEKALELLEKHKPVVPNKPPYPKR